MSIDARARARRQAARLRAEMLAEESGAARCGGSHRSYVDLSDLEHEALAVVIDARWAVTGRRYARAGMIRLLIREAHEQVIRGTTDQGARVRRCVSTPRQPSLFDEVAP